jgi:hypothetical protein
MHLGFKTVSFCHIVRYQFMGVLVLHISSGLPPDSDFLYNMCPKEAHIKIIKHIQFLDPSVCLSKCLGNRTSFKFPNGALLDRVSHFQSLLLCVSIVLHKFFSDKKEFYTSLKGPNKGRSSLFPKTVPQWKQSPISRALFNIYFVTPSKGSFSRGFPQRASTERDAPFPDPFFTRLSKCRVNKPLSSFPRGAPMKIDARLQSLVLHNLQSPQ